ncbi:unnamed protein product [Bursaphelenchus xylophilus]|uniref:(pine wood nematode) hypothetical protein n=1 Tax=Bursaphelenchus xylophilus TaxID=6326 RepID=A0A7I8X3P3_BURXY|nr:unnamed protein product [Bursaphelenchus xylophilus]CAG9128782.1 unnamed protein product [Bursaphelenchus xylophilus]
MDFSFSECQQPPKTEQLDYTLTSGGFWSDCRDIDPRLHSQRRFGSTIALDSSPVCFPSNMQQAYPQPITVAPANSFGSNQALQSPSTPLADFKPVSRSMECLTQPTTSNLNHLYNAQAHMDDSKVNYSYDNDSGM